MTSPLYTPENVRVAYQLNWSLALFWNEPPPAVDWLEPLCQAVEPDGVRILEHRLTKPNVSQFLLSTTPHVAPSVCIRSVKGRLQYLVRDRIRRAFRRNYAIKSVGSINAQAVQQYVANQIQHHPMADSRLQEMLAQYQFADPTIDLSEIRRTSHGEFIYNLHLVLVQRKRAIEIDENFFRISLRMIRGTAGKRDHLLSRAGLLVDHMHSTMGCGIQESPLAAGLSYLINLAYSHGMRDLFEYGLYVGTFGPYDLNAARRLLAGESPVEPRGGEGFMGRRRRSS